MTEYRPVLVCNQSPHMPCDHPGDIAAGVTEPRREIVLGKTFPDAESAAEYGHTQRMRVYGSDHTVQVREEQDEACAGCGDVPDYLSSDGYCDGCVIHGV